MPFFSIVLPTYNRAHMLSKAVESVISQTFTDWELIIVDDGSTDNTKELVNTYIDSRIHYIFQSNQERSAARNNGIEKANGEYICFLDSDDYFLKDKLFNLKDFIVKNDLQEVIVYDNVYIENNKTLIQLPILNQSEYKSTFEFLLFNSLYSQQMCISKTILTKFQYNTKIVNNEDTELWIRISEEHSLIHLKESIQTVIVEHSYRSINSLDNAQLENVLMLYKHIFKATPSGSRISKKNKHKIFSNLYFNIAKIKMQQGEKLAALKWLLKSLAIYPFGSRSKHILYCIKFIIFGKTPTQYQK